MKHLLVTGASGYLGSRVLAKLLAKGYSVTALCPCRQDCLQERQNLTTLCLDETPPEDAFKTNTFGIIHFAPCYGRSAESDAKIAAVNLLLPLKLLELAVENKVKFFINTDTILSPKLNAYALTKHQFAKQLDVFAAKIKCINMRLDHFYGPFDTPNKFIASILQALSKNEPEINLTEGTQTRDFIYIDDVINAYMRVLEEEPKLPAGKVNTFEVATGTQISIKDAVLTLKRLLGNRATKLNFGALPPREHEVASYDIDTSSLTALGWRAQVNFEEGIKRIIEEEKS